MNGIIGMTELALSTDLTPEQREYLDLVRISADSLLSLINDILDFSKIEAGKLTLENIEFNLRETINDTLKALALRASEKQLELICHIPMSLQEVLIGDPSRLRQVIVNLVSNAIKFTEEGEVVVAVGIQSQAAGEVCLRFDVSDTGIGIPIEKQQSIFEAFSQADGSTTRKYGGTGLGLAISTQLVDLMGGTIRVDSEEGRGSTFVFTSRFAVREGALQTYKFTTQPNLEGLRVLVIDDHAINRRIFEEFLCTWGLQPTLASSGREGLDEMKRSSDLGVPFALVLLDFHMPDLDGLMVAEKIRENPEFAAVPIMLLSSTEHHNSADNFERLGIKTRLAKPIRPAELLEAINKSFGGSRKNEQITLSLPVRSTSERRLAVLLAEDNRINQRLVVRILQKEGHIVTVAETGRDAVAEYRRQPFDIVLMDVQMPDMNGYEATAIIREIERTTGIHTSIVAMTAHALNGDRERCIDAGMDGYISKPAKPKDLLQAISSFAPPSLTLTRS